MSDAKVVIITGAASGIGAETARMLAAKGWRVVVNYRKSREAGVYGLEEFLEYKSLQMRPAKAA